MAKIDVIYGAPGSGKSSYAFSLIDPRETFKLGTSSEWLDWLCLRPGSTKKHEEDNVRMGIRTVMRTTLRSVSADVKMVDAAILLIDEWSAFFSYSLFWPEKDIKAEAAKIVGTIHGNCRIQRAILICLDYQIILPFRLHKKRSLWNKIAFSVADSIVNVEFGYPIKIK